MHSTFLIIKEQIIQRLRKGLSPTLTYHSLNHTLDVLHRAEEIAGKENNISEHDFYLLRIASLYHDSGFLVTYKGHEEKSCDLARKDLLQLGMGIPEIESICAMIMATALPQSPKNKLEEIICDADLDYLGRYDFFPIAGKLYQEMKLHGMVQNENEWNQIQKKFLEEHRYFTDTNKQNREPKKQEHLAAITQLPGPSAAQ